MADDMTARTKIFAALTGRSDADVSGEPASDLRGMLIAAFGTQKRDSTRPDVTAAAKGLRVSARTVRRWIAREDARERSRPSAANFAKLATRARQAATTKRGRERALRQSFGDRGRPSGLRFSVKALQGVEPAYWRLRTVNFDLDRPEFVDGFLDAFVERGHEGAMGWLRDNIDIVYGVDSWSFGEIGDVGMSGLYGGEDL